MDITHLLKRVQQSYQVLQKYMQEDFKFEQDMLAMTRTFVINDDECQSSSHSIDSGDLSDENIVKHPDGKSFVKYRIKN